VWALLSKPPVSSAGPHGWRVSSLMLFFELFYIRFFAGICLIDSVFDVESLLGEHYSNYHSSIQFQHIMH
jgi:hypothetical protein